MQSIIPSDDLSDHPFTSRLEDDEPLLWFGRPDEAVFMRQQRRGLFVGTVLFCFLMASVAFQKVYAPSRADDFFFLMFLMFLILLPMTLVLGVYFTRNAYQHAPWYALTHRNLFAATPDEGCFMIHKTAWTMSKVFLYAAQTLMSVRSAVRAMAPSPA